MLNLCQKIVWLWFLCRADHACMTFSQIDLFSLTIRWKRIRFDLRAYPRSTSPSERFLLSSISGSQVGRQATSGYSTTVSSPSELRNVVSFFFSADKFDFRKSLTECERFGLFATLHSSRLIWGGLGGEHRTTALHSLMILPSFARKDPKGRNQGEPAAESSATGTYMIILLLLWACLLLHAFD